MAKSLETDIRLIKALGYSFRVLMPDAGSLR